MQDRHATAEATPVKDAIQDYQLLEATQEDNLTTLVFKRKIDTCEPDDYYFQVSLINSLIKIL